MSSFAFLRRLTSGALAAAAAGAALALAACSDSTAPRTAATATMGVTVRTAAAPQVASLVVEISAADIATPALYTLQVVDSVASGSLRIVPGPQRTFTVRARDAQGGVTHEGSATVDVRPGQNPPLSIQLVPKSGQVPITVSFGTVNVVITRPGGTFAPGDTVRATALVYGSDGKAIPGATVSWASSNAAKATVDDQGLITVRDSGVVTVAAMYDGVAGATRLTVGRGLWQSLTTGVDHVCALTAEGKAYCWGGNQWGQLGNGSTNSESQVPVAVSGNLTFREIAAGAWTTCGITTANAAYCWGYGADGQLGIGSNLQVANTPRQVAGSYQWQSIAAGTKHACGITAAGKAYCWGLNESGQLGDGTKQAVMRWVPVAVAGALTFKQISAGDRHTCAVTTTGAGYCWGLNDAWQVGDAHDAADTSATRRWAPTTVAGGLTWRSITTAAVTSCGVTENDTGYCWGRNGAGTLGTTTDQAAIATSPAPLATSLKFRKVYAASYIACGVTTTDAMACWGGFNGIVPYASNVSPNLVPALVSVGGPVDDTDEAFGWACLVTKNGQLQCSGLDSHGSLGNGNGGSAVEFRNVVTP